MADDDKALFDGTGGVDGCMEFVRSVRSYAFGQGKMRDDEWMADYASTRVAGRAGVWFESLEEETQTSWKLLRRALMDEYAAANGGSSSAVIPTPAAAPPTQILTSNSLLGAANPQPMFLTGLLRLIGAGVPDNTYVSRERGFDFKDPSILQSTASRQDALKVSYQVSPAGTSTLEAKNAPVEGEYSLGFVWVRPDPALSRGSVSFAGMVAERTGASHSIGQPNLYKKVWKGPITTGKWRIAPSGEVTVECKGLDQKIHVLENVVYVGETSGNLYLFVDLEAYQAANPNTNKRGRKCRITIENA